MEDKKILKEEELSAVVGGFANEDDIMNAFGRAAGDFKELYHCIDNTMGTQNILNDMWSECMHMAECMSMSEKTSLLEWKVNHVIERLEELCSSLVNVANTTCIPDTARDILNKLKGSLGL